MKKKFGTHFKELISGVLLGAVYLMPGVCSASTAILLGCYDDLLELTGSPGLRTILRHKWFCLGIMAGLMMGLLVIEQFLVTQPVIFLSFFLGFNIFGSVYLGKEIIRNCNVGRSILFIIGLIIVVSTTFLQPTTGFPLQYVLGGFLVALAFIMPGVSGSLLMLVLGIYEPILEVISFARLGGGVPHLSILVNLGGFAFAFIVGLVLFSRVIIRVKIKYAHLFNFLTLGMLLGSLYLLADEMRIKVGSLLNGIGLLLCVIAILCGGGFYLLMSHLLERKKKNEVK